MDPADFDPSKPMSPAMEALQILKYDSDSAECEYFNSIYWK